MMLIHLDLLHLCGHLVDLVLLESSHMCHAHSSFLLLPIIEGVDRIALGSVGRELRLFLSSIERHDRVLGI